MMIGTQLPLNNFQATKQKYVYAASEDGFDIYLGQPVYCSIVCSSPAYIENTLTGENIGTRIDLVKYLYNLDGSINENPKKDPKNYQVRFVDYG